MLAFNIANILMFISGTALTWSSPETLKMTNANTSPFGRPITSEESTWVSSLITLGAAFGPFLFANLADRMGRKYTLLSMGVPFLVCYLMIAFGRVIELFYVARFVMGLTLGGAFTVLPIYACEVAHKSNRGAISSLMGCAICSGLLFSYSLGPFVSVMTFNLVLAAFPLAFLILFAFLGKEVPHYYVSINEDDLAKEALQKLRRHSYGGVDEELLEIQNKYKETSRAGSFLDIFRAKASRKAFMMSVTLLIFQQFSGINVVFFYGQKIFQEVGSSLTPQICTIIIGGVQFLSSFIAPLIGDKFGRKTILTVSAIGMVLSEGSLGAYCYLKDKGIYSDCYNFLPVLFFTSYIIFYNSGYGPLPWSMMGELFPSNIKSIAISVVTSINWMLAFFLTKYFEAMLLALGVAEYFWLYTVCCVFAAIFSRFILLETRGKSLQQIQDELER